MLLSDGDIRQILSQLEFETDDNRRPFKPDEQIQPASIDLRLDRCFWFPLRSHRNKISFLSVSLSELEMQRLFERRWFRLGERVTLKPGELVLGRTYETFTIPNGYAGKLEGRSTFARLGLSIHCTGDFINPGWRGRMPLQLVNHGKVPIEITPYVDICQLIIFKTTSSSEKAYGSDELSSKYMNEEGEPSRVWMDARLNKLREACGKVNLAGHIHKEFVRVLGKKDVRILDRFTVFLDAQSHSELTSAREVMERFADREKHLKAWASRRHAFFKWLPFALFSTSLALLVRPPYSYIHAISWAVTALFLIPGIYYMFFADPPGEFFLHKDLET
ncbi:dCTP deaminase [Tautonia sp. JC769]|uniref:dCTP deaminase n=1 Tax=Tautonia sp. JC769 TaxID=3232135 RepID=UPI0034582560